MTKEPADREDFVLTDEDIETVGGKVAGGQVRPGDADGRDGDSGDSTDGRDGDGSDGGDADGTDGGDADGTDA